MELEVVTPKSPSNPQSTIAETPAKPADAPSTGTPTTAAGGEAAATGAPGAAPGSEKPDRPGRRAAAAKKLERQASERAAEAERKVTETAPVAEKVAKYQAAIESGDVDKILEAFGIDDEALVDRYLAKHGEKAENGGKRPQDDEIRKELDTIKQQLADAKVKEQEMEAQRTISGHVDNLKSIATRPEHADRYEMLNAEGAHDLAFDVMVQFHQQHKKFLSYEEALDAVEDHLVTTERARIDRNSKIKKLGLAAVQKQEEKAGTAPAAAAATDDSAEMQRIRAAFKATRPRMTNSMSTSMPSSSPGPKTRSEADKRFRERVLGLARESAN